LDAGRAVNSARRDTVAVIYCSSKEYMVSFIICGLFILVPIGYFVFNKINVLLAMVAELVTSKIFFTF
jgi:hypothetical protein